MSSKYPNLEKFSSKLDACIRCGYCYEHCPLFKHTRWESDAPRAKLVLLHGLLRGDLEPTPAVARKLFECFHCKRCEAVCSADIPFTAILDAARADLAAAGIVHEGSTSVTDHGACSLCLACVRMCRHEARYYDAELNQVMTDPTRCQGCGVCLDLCPALAASIPSSFGTDYEDLLEQVSAFLRDQATVEPRAVVFTCNWSNYPGLQSAHLASGTLERGYRVFVTACTGRLYSLLILRALELGAWGVLVTSCPEEDCEHGGALRAHRRIELLHRSLAGGGVELDRIRFREVGKGDQAGFQAAVDEFVSRMEELGPLSKAG